MLQKKDLEGLRPSHVKNYVKQNMYTQDDTYINIIKNIQEYLIFRNTKVWVIVVGVRADMDYPVHVEVQVVELWNLKGIAAGTVNSRLFPAHECCLKRTAAKNARSTERPSAK